MWWRGNNARVDITPAESAMNGCVNQDLTINAKDTMIVVLDKLEDAAEMVRRQLKELT